jgi:aspartate aminotransferase
VSLSVSPRMARVRPSPTGAVLALVTELRAQGRDIISLGTGEPDFDTPKHIRDAAVAAISAGETRYTPIDGTAALKAAIQRKFARENGLHYETSAIIVTCGGKQALFNLCMALLTPGDEAVIAAPFWVSYPDMVLLAEGEPVIIDTGIEQQFKMTPAQLEAALNDRTRLVMLNSPCNPTGASYTRSELQEFGAVLEDYPGVVIVSDDIYEHIYWADDPFVTFAAACPTLFDRAVTVNGVSKAYAMTGWRIGYAGGPEWLIAAMKTVQSQSTSNPCSVSQAAARAALEGDQSPVQTMRDAYRVRHDYLVGALNGVPGMQCRAGEGAFYAFPRVQDVVDRLGLADDTALAEMLIRDAEVACVPGAAFGAPGYLRMSFACSVEVLEEAINRLNRVLAA